MPADTANKTSFLLPNMLAFTVIEVMVILIILMCLFVFIVPAGNEVLVEHRAIAGSNRIVSGLYLARNEAIQRGEKIIFCKSADSKSCSGNWNDGQIIINSKGAVLHRFAALGGNDSLIWNSSAGKDNWVEWLPTGFTNGQRGSFYYCAANDNAAYSQAIVLINTGRLYVSQINAEDFDKYCPH